mgnify:FL=1
MTESQFNRTLALWKACEKHNLTTAQMFHISEIIRSYSNPDLIISAYENEAEKLPVINGVPRKITLCSNGICYGPCPEPDEERIQKVTISANGKVYITLKNYEGVILRKIQKRIPAEMAAGWLGDVGTHLSVLIDLTMITDVGSWEAVIVNEENKKFRISGYLADGDKWLDKYSDDLREMLDMPELYVFNEKSYSAVRLCSCEFEYGGKQYYYQTEDKTIHIGDTVIVPVGKSNEQKKVRVVNIESLDEADLPFELERIKTIIRKIESDPSGSDLLNLPKLNKEFSDEALGRAPSVFEIVKSAIDSADCMGLLKIGAPQDEYDGESRSIASKIKPQQDIYQIASVIAQEMSDSFSEPFGINGFLETAAQIKKKYDCLYQLKGDSMHIADMCECFDKMDGKQVRVTMKDGKVFTGILDDWIQTLDNEPDPESIILKTTVYPCMELYVKDILFICLSLEDGQEKMSLKAILSSKKKLTAEEAASYIDTIETERELAALFAYVDNKAWDIADNEYDFEEGTELHKSACEETDKWFAVADRLKEKIFSILRRENVSIPKKGQIDVLVPFMKRNGFTNENGWWNSIS